MAHNILFKDESIIFPNDNLILQSKDKDESKINNDKIKVKIMEENNENIL